jgi:GNAT superfamily N-acetyltransferase
LAAAVIVSEPGAPTVLTRRGGVDDIDAILQNVHTGFRTYADFAPAGWSAPNVRLERERTLDLLEASGTAVVIAEVDGAVTGHVGLTPARERPPGGGSADDWRTRQEIAGMAHLWQLFVLPEWWGTGVADVLHREFVAEAAGRGYAQARLYTPAAHGRARRFYERRGWRSISEQLNPELGLAVAEYRVVLNEVRN